MKWVPGMTFKPSEEFLLRFNAMSEATNDSPQTLLNFFRDKKDLIGLAEGLKETADRIDLIHAHRKVHAQVPDDFSRAWGEYNRRWRNVIDYIQLYTIWPTSFGSMQSFQEFEASQARQAGYLSPDPESDWRFDPTTHNGGDAIHQFLHEANLMAQVALPDAQNGEELTNIFNVGIEALEFVQNDIGLDFDEVFERWNRAPQFHVPKHVSNRYGLSEKGSLFELLNDSIRAYIAGAPAASVAMCRAALEMVLKDHYLRGEVTGKDKLWKIVELASARYEFLSKAKLESLAENANRIMHNYAGRKKLDEQDEALLLSFIKDLAFYIRRAPERPARSK
jgi:hypothetical protein